MIDIHEMGRAGHAIGHDRHKALAAGNDPSVIRSDLGQDADGVFDRRWTMMNESCGLQAGTSLAERRRRSGPPGSAGGTVMNGHFDRQSVAPQEKNPEIGTAV